MIFTLSYRDVKRDFLNPWPSLANQSFGNWGTRRRNMGPINKRYERLIYVKPGPSLCQ